MKKRVVIFTASTGQGHNQVASSMKIELENKGCEVSIIEPLKEISKSLDLLVSDGYRVLATKMPKMYGTIYKMSNSNHLLNKPVERISQKTLHMKLKEIINAIEPDLVISTHPIMVKTICNLKNSGYYTGAFISIITDYLPHEFYISNLVDAYIVGSQYTKDKVIERGINPNKIFVHGIPIKREFSESKTTMTKSDEFTILLMGGSMGLSSIKKAYKTLTGLSYNLKLIVVCGNNESLKKTLEYKYGIDFVNKDIEVLGFTDKISQYMEISDLIITKPGGLTVTEAFAKNTPMLIPYFIPGQEEENAEMLVEVGAAFRVDNTKELGLLIESLIENRGMLDVVKDNMYNVSKDHSLDHTIELCMNLIDYNSDMAVQHAK